MDDASFNALLGKAYWGKTEEVMSLVDKDPALALRTGRGGETLLHHACMGRHIELAKKLLARGADKLARNDKEMGALQFAEGDAGLTSLLNEKEKA
jgi:ankyrin repeat protein